jgi:ketosteroid isomerase-like protein
VLALYDPHVELDATALGLVAARGDVLRGHEGLRSFFREWHEAWGEIHYDYEELIPVGEQVISIVTRHARGRASGVEVEQPFALLWTLRDGKVIRVVWFLERAAALQAAELDA